MPRHFIAAEKAFRCMVPFLAIMLGHSLALVAAPPEKAGPSEADGVYAVGGTEAMFAFRVDPWSASMHQIRGVGRASIAGPAAADVYFEILGTYLPDQAQRASGLLLYREGQAVATVPWQGSFDAKTDSLEWNAEVGSRSLPLPKVQSLFAKGGAHPGPPELKAVVKKLGKGKAPQITFDLSGKDGELDFGKVIVTVLELTPDVSAPEAVEPAKEAARAEQPSLPKPAPPIPAWKGPRSPEADDMVIIEAVTDLGAGHTGNAVLPPLGTPLAELPARTPKELIDAVLRTSVPARGRRTYPPVSMTPGSTPVANTPPVSKPTPKTEESRTSGLVVPNLVGMKFEAAVNQVWALGLNPASVDCLGPAKTQAQAERVVAQTPPPGSPYPADRNMRLQWYAPMEREPDTADGFLVTDGPKVDIRFTESKVMQNGRAIGDSEFKGKEGYAWGIMPADDPAFQATRAAVAQRMNDKSTSAVTIEETMRKEAPDDFGFEHSQRANFNGDIFDTTELHRIVAHRGFVIYYFHKREGLHQPIAAVAETVVENSRRLIDLRFPEKAKTP